MGNKKNIFKKETIVLSVVKVICKQSNKQTNKQSNYPKCRKCKKVLTTLWREYKIEMCFSSLWRNPGSDEAILVWRRWSRTWTRSDARAGSVGSELSRLTIFCWTETPSRRKHNCNMIGTTVTLSDVKVQKCKSFNIENYQVPNCKPFRETIRLEQYFKPFRIVSSDYTIEMKH